MKQIIEYINESNNNDIIKCAKYLAKIISNTDSNQKSFEIFMDKLYQNIDNDNPDELFWELLKNNFEENGWIIDRKMK